jgi:hypothetical protein
MTGTVSITPNDLTCQISVAFPFGREIATINATVMSAAAIINSLINSMESLLLALADR